MLYVFQLRQAPCDAPCLDRRPRQVSGKSILPKVVQDSGFVCIKAVITYKEAVCLAGKEVLAL
jgi:hypothetical protein